MKEMNEMKKNGATAVGVEPRPTATVSEQGRNETYPGGGIVLVWITEKALYELRAQGFWDRVVDRVSSIPEARETAAMFGINVPWPEEVRE